MNRRQRAEVAVQAAAIVLSQGPLIARTARQVWEEHIEDRDLYAGPCDAFADDAEFAVRLMLTLDPLIVLPEPADTILDGTTLLIALGVAGATRLLRRGKGEQAGDRLERAIESQLTRRGKRQLGRAERRLDRLA